MIWLLATSAAKSTRTALQAGNGSMDAPILRLDRHSLPGPHILPAAPRVSLEILRGRACQRRREVGGKVFLVGSAADCDLVVGDPQFPEAYAYLFVAGSQVTIRRLGAGPALAVCGQSVETVELYHGDLLQFGPFELRVIIDHPPRRSLHDADQRGAQADQQEDDGHDEAVGEVQSLLADVREALADRSASLRLYEEPDDEPAASPVHAAIRRRRASA